MTYKPTIINKISTLNSRSASTLGAGAVFQGVGEDVSLYGRAGISITSDNATDGVLTIEVSRDGTTWGGPTRTFSDTRFSQPHMWNIVEKYFRIKYTNGTTEAQNLAIQVQYSVNSDILLGHQLDETLLDETEALITRSIGVGQDPNSVYKNLVSSGVDDGNSSTTNLTTGTSLTFTGSWREISGYSGISVLVDGTASGTVGGTLQMQFSHDGVTAHRNIQIVNPDITNVPPRTLGVVAQYFRVIFTADSDLTSFVLETMFHTEQVGLVSRLDSFLQGNEDVTNVRAAIVGKTDGGVYNNVNVSGRGKLAVDLPLTAFGDLRTAELTPVVQVSFEYTVGNTEIGTIETAGSGTVTQADAMVVVESGTTTASTAEWETVRNVKYRPGLGGVMRFAGLFTQGVAGTEQIIGLADTEGVSASHENGYALGYNGVDFALFRWQNDTAFIVNQSVWDDPMDGTGASGMVLDPTKLNVYYIQFQYLGAGAIKLFIEDDSTGDMVLAHTILYSNLNTTPSVYSPNFHMMVHVLNKATTDNVIAKCSSMAYFTEGYTKYAELQQPQQSSGSIEKNSITTEIALFTIRNKATYASKTNFLEAVLELLTASIEAGATNNLGNVRLVRNATLGGTPSYTDINATDSIMEIDIAGTTVSNGKELLSSPLAGKNDRDLLNLDLFDLIMAPNETITVAASSANSATITASILWKELF